jgi:predicted NBD/HSP70 family sugar kinase
VSVRSGKSAVDPSRMRAHNRSLVLRILWEQQPISAADLARATGMSPSTISGIVQELEEVGLVATIGPRPTHTGRRAVPLELAPESFAALGVELGGRHVAALVCDLRGRTLAFQDAQHPVRTDPQGALALVSRLLDAAIAEARVPRRRLLGLGVAVPSPLQRDRPGHLLPLIYPAWRDVDLDEELRRTQRLPVAIDNDANLGALGERWWGAGGTHLAYIKVGGGVGCGYIIDGKLHRGASGTAGEIGHTPIDPAGPPCICGNRGCVTTYVGAEALLARAHALAGAPSKAPKVRTLSALIAQARTGDAVACRVLAEAGTHLGVVIGSLINLNDPGVVVLGGELSAAGELVLEPLRREVQRRILPSTFATTRIVATQLGRRGLALGAATLVLRQAVDQGELFAAAERARGTGPA